MNYKNNNLIKNIVNKVLDQVFLCNTKEALFSYFVDVNNANTAINLIKKEHKKIFFEIYGGADDLERVLIGTSLNEISYEQFPIKKVKFTYDKYGTVNHRHILGTILGNGIDRSRVGDILIFKDYAIVFVHFSIVDAVSSIEKIGKFSISPEILEGDDFFIPLQNYIEKNISNDSLKISDVVSLSFKISKTSVKELIKSKKVLVDGSEIKKDVVIKNDISITVRSFGKIILTMEKEKADLKIYR